MLTQVISYLNRQFQLRKENELFNLTYYEIHQLNKNKEAKEGTQ